jgi:uncharacterized protein (TIGR02996 family)
MIAQTTDSVKFLGVSFPIIDITYFDPKPEPFVNTWVPPDHQDRRSFAAEWEIDEQQLFRLVSISAPILGGSIPFHRLYPNEPTSVMSRYIGEIVLLDEQQRRYEPMGNSSRLVYETFLMIQNGKLVLREVYDLRNGQRVEAEITPYLEDFFPEEEAAFLRRINQDIVDQAPKLIYADWLEEHQLESQAEQVREYAKLWINSGPKLSLELPTNRNSYPSPELNYLWLRLLGFREGASNTYRDYRNGHV